MRIGIPENTVIPLMMAAFIVKGIQPGPNMIAKHPDLFWGGCRQLWVGNCFLRLLNVPMVRFWLSLFKPPYNVLFPIILFFCCIGTYSVNNNLDDIFVTTGFGVIGYVFLRLALDPAPRCSACSPPSSSPNACLRLLKNGRRHGNLRPTERPTA